MSKILLTFLVSMLLIFSSSANAKENEDSLPLRGINFVGPGFASSEIPGKLNVNYVFPSNEDIKTYADFGMEIIRLSFLWERLQPELNGPFNQDYLQNIIKVVNEADKYGVYVLLDVHNYGKYKDALIGSKAVPQQDYADMWFKLATYFKDHDNAMFGLMNEPYKHSPKEWFPLAQAGLSAIREGGAKQKILVPSTYWSSAAKFTRESGGFSNAELLKNINDPENNFVYELHIYFDKDSSGTHNNCPGGEEIGIKRLEAVTKWLKDNNHQALLGEFGVSEDETCLKVLDKTLAYMDENKEAWFGWTYWGASPWFGDYMFNVYPPDTDKFPQAAILKKYIQKK